MFSGEVLLDLVNDVLDYTRLEADEGAVQPMVFSQRDIVERVARLSMAEAAPNGCAWFWRSWTPALLADGARIQRFLLNLISNAVKFTREGSVWIHVGAVDGGLTFVIRDTGPGNPQQEQDKVFRPFFQSVVGGADHAAGTGLGLATCARLADLIGADLTLAAPQDGGALFQLDCPVILYDMLEPEPPSDHGSIRPLAILGVEDNVVNAMVIDGFLAAGGHRITVVTSCEAALHRLRQDSFDLALMDIGLQGADGFEVIRQIRASDDPATAVLPILVLTADLSGATASQFERSGADAFQTKPLGRDPLRHALWRVMTRSADMTARVQDRPVAPNGMVLDMSVIAEHRRVIGPERTGHIVAAFLATALRHETALTYGAKAGDAGAMGDILHGPRSAAPMIGLIRLGQVAQITEQTLRADDDAVDLIGAARTVCTEIAVARSALQMHA